MFAKVDQAFVKSNTKSVEYRGHSAFEHRLLRMNGADESGLAREMPKTQGFQIAGSKKALDTSLG